MLCCGELPPLMLEPMSPLNKAECEATRLSNRIGHKIGQEINPVDIY